MFTEIYIEALLVDEALADKVWQLWNDRDIDNAIALLAWLLVATQIDCATQSLY
jgi:hypothetical protein